jgi:hypothetical protein
MVVDLYFKTDIIKCKKNILFRYREIVYKNTKKVCCQLLTDLYLTTIYSNSYLNDRYVDVTIEVNNINEVKRLSVVQQYVFRLVILIKRDNSDVKKISKLYEYVLKTFKNLKYVDSKRIL